jgi:hypothetical protein
LKLGKVLCKGAITLYTFNLLKQDSYYNLIQNQVFVAGKEGQNYVLLEGKTNPSVLYHQFRRVLDYLTSDMIRGRVKVSNLNYNIHDVQLFIQRYNAFKAPGKDPALFRSKMKPTLSHEIHAGISYIPKFTYIFDFPLKNGKGFSIGYHFNINSPSVSKKIYSGVGLSYFYYKWSPVFFERGNRAYIIEDPMRGLNLSLSGTYLFNNRGVTPFLLAGMVVSFSNIHPFVSYLNIGIGEQINRFKISLSYAQALFAIFRGTNGILSFDIGFSFLQTKRH